MTSSILHCTVPMLFALLMLYLVVPGVCKLQERKDNNNGTSLPLVRRGGYKTIRRIEARQGSFLHKNGGPVWHEVLNKPLSESGRQITWKVETKIAGGNVAPESIYIHAAHLTIYFSDGANSVCSGSILDSKRILTAGHCFLNYDDKFDVVRVVVQIGKWSDRGLPYEAKSVDVSRKYDIPSFQNDVAIVTLFQTLNGYYQPVNLSSCSNCFPKRNMSVSAAGFGSTDNYGGETSELLETELIVQPYKKCKKRYRRLSRSKIVKKFSKLRMFCAMDALFPYSAFRAVCRGDSGGPIFSKSDDALTQIGLTSFGTSPCNESGAVDWFVNLSHYTSVINDYLNGKYSEWSGIFGHPYA